jgi:hypothetical protein
MVTDEQRKAVFIAKLKGACYHHGRGAGILSSRERLQIARELIELGVIELHPRASQLPNLFIVRVSFALSPKESFDAGCYVTYGSQWMRGPAFKVQTFTRMMPPK